MATHFRDLKTIKPWTAAEFCRIALDCREYLSPTDSWKYASAQMEYRRQTGSWRRYLKFNPRAWAWQHHDDCSRLLFPYGVYDANLPDYLDFIWHSKPVEKARTGFENFQRVLGAEGLEKYQTSVASSILYHNLLTWSSVLRGRDLFIRGLGGFTIPSVSTNTHITDVYTFQARKYSEKIFLDAPVWHLSNIFRNREKTRYLVQWRQWYEQNSDTVDELSNWRGSLEMDLHPERQFTRTIQTVEDIIQHTNFDWVTHSEPEIQGFLMKPIRDSETLLDVGKKLNNCAYSYRRLIEEKEYLLVSAYQGGYPVGLGAWHLEAMDWVEIRERFNAMPSPILESAFRTYGSLELLKYRFHEV